MAEKKWEANEMLDRYIYDYLMKRNLHESAKAFLEETKVSTESVEIEAPGGFLYEWWCIVWDMHAARYNQKRSESVAGYLEEKQRRAKEYQHQIQMHQMHQMQPMQQRNLQLQRRDAINQSIGGPMGALNSDGMLGQPSASVVAMKLYEEHMKIPQSMDSKTSASIIDANKMALLKSAAIQQSQSLHGNAMDMCTPADLRKMEFRSQLANITDASPEGNLNGAHKSHTSDPSSLYGQSLMQSNFGPCVAGLNQGVANMPLKGWPLTEPVRPRPNLGAQFHQNNNVSNQAQILLAQSQARGNIVNSSTYVNTDTSKYGGCPSRGVSAKNEQSMRSPTPSSSPQMNMEQAQIASSQQQNHPQQQMQNNNKRKQPSSSGHAASNGNVNTPSQSPNSPSSTHLPGDGITKTPTLLPANSPRNSMVYHQEETPGLLSSFDHLEDINNLEDMSFLDENLESYFNNEGGEGKDGFNTQSSMQIRQDISKGTQLPSPNI